MEVQNRNTVWCLFHDQKISLELNRKTTQTDLLVQYTCICWQCRDIWATSWQNQQCGCAPSEDSDQPGHPPSLIKVFAVRMKKAWVLSYLLSAQRRLWSGCADAQADWVFAGHTVILLFLSWGGSFKVSVILQQYIIRVRAVYKMMFVCFEALWPSQHY